MTSLWLNDRIPVPNTSNGIHSIMLEWVRKHWHESYQSCVLVTEPEDGAAIVSRELYDVPVDAIPNAPDLNVLVHWQKRYDVVICQAVLEHLCRPSVAVENLVRLATVGGLVSLHTHIPPMPYHGWPIDCIRVFPDFFRDLQKYLPYELLEIQIHEPYNIFALLRTRDAA
jgi:hypothetical protein